MCGIFYYECATKTKLSIKELAFFHGNFSKILHRGPDKSVFVNDGSRVFGFHRLAINGHTSASEQPFYIKGCRLICNGEIYNFRSLITKYSLEKEYTSDSDCEIIIHLYKKIGLHNTLKELDGVFSFVLYDYKMKRVIAARDPVGVRALYIGSMKHAIENHAIENHAIEIENHTVDENTEVGNNKPKYCNDIAIASEMKALSFCSTVVQFPPGCYMMYENEVLDPSDRRASFYSYYEPVSLRPQPSSDSPVSQYSLANHIREIFVDYKYKVNDPTINNETNTRVYIPEGDIERSICSDIRTLFIDAVKKRLMSERPVGCLLSGGLDSSVTTALVSKFLDEKADKEGSERHPLKTYSIGLAGSVDLQWARKVAEYLKTDHHEVVVSEEDFLAAINETIYQTESYCTTTIRASVGNYLVSKYIYSNTNDVVIYCGDMSDEIFGSYRGFLKAPNDDDFHRENERMIRDVHFFDLLRSDKSISGAGLEARVPFADKTFLTYVMQIPARFKRFDDTKIEKYLFRKAFNDMLPHDVMWRRKEAFSDGVSGSDGRTWIDIIKEYVNTQVSDEEFELNKNTYEYNPPYDKESYFYRRVFESYFPGRADTIPYYWRHPFCDGVLDPSARLLDFYKR
jgi:asparagine synthase (glutamine-hydrolysing)